MEQKKTQRADIDQRRTTGFLLGLTFVLALFYVCLEWNAVIGNDGFIPLDIDEMVHESDLIPMSNVETMTQMTEKKQIEKAEQLNVVDDNVEISEPDDEELEGEMEGDDEALLKELEESMDDDKALASLGVDPNTSAEGAGQGACCVLCREGRPYLGRWRYPFVVAGMRPRSRARLEHDAQVETRHSERPPLSHQGVHPRRVPLIASKNYALCIINYELKI